MDYPEYVKIEDKIYKMNTDFRIALECNRIAEDETINDYERVLAIIYKLFGDEGIDNTQHHEMLFKKAQKYLLAGDENVAQNNKEPDMDYLEDMDYIEASFMSDYKIDLSNEKMHWWKFHKLINGLSGSEFGNSCILNRIRDLRNYNTSEIKDSKKRQEIEEAKRKVALKKKRKVNIGLTEEQEKSMNELNELLGL